MLDDFEELSKSSESLLNNQYKLKEKIGEGSYGTVYKAEDTKNKNNLVAIKQLSKSKICENAYLFEALKKELDIMKLISDENSVKLMDFFETEEKYNLVMELCDSDLDVQLKKINQKNHKSFSELELFEIMTQFNKIFHKLQENHVIHRDLKLKNIMIKYDKKIPLIGFIIKLSDFGFSKVLNEENITNTNLGTPSTKAPEIMFGNEYNAKADLWSVGVIIYQLLYNQLPFPANNVTQLKQIIMKSNEVKLPEKNNNPISKVCFDLIKRLLQKNPKDRIEFNEYFDHKFFSEEHKKELIEGNKNDLVRENDDNLKNDTNKKNENERKNLNEGVKIDKVDNESIKNNSKNNNNISNNINEGTKNNICNNNEKEELIDFNARFIDIRKLSESSNEQYTLYKAKDKKLNKNVYIKQISKTIIDTIPRNKKIFNNEIELLNKLSGKDNFTEFIGLFITDTYYNIVIEFFSGNNLDNFIKNRQFLNEILVSSILKQLKSSFSYLNEENIILEYISPKSFAFVNYYNDSNFEIKFFDYGLHGIFIPDIMTKSYLLDEAELGEVSEKKTNVLSLGLVIYKMLFGEDKYKFNNKENYKQKIKSLNNEVIKRHVNENCKNFLIKSINIQKEKRYDWKNLLLDDFLNLCTTNSNLLLNSKYILTDEQIEFSLDVISNKIKNVIKYFNKKEMNKEIDIFLLLCIMECKTIKNFININADLSINKIDPANQEIHILQIYTNNYDYSFINFINDKKYGLYYYNKENPFFEKFRKNFYELEAELIKIYNSINTKDESGISSNNSSGKDSDIKIMNESNKKEENDENNILNENEFKEGNIEKLYTKFFENGVLHYSEKQYENAIEELTIAKYISEYTIFIRLILGNKKETKEIKKIFENLENKNFMISFIGGKIRQMKTLGILGCNNGNGNENNEMGESVCDEEDNIKIYENMISFFPKINIFIEEINKEKNIQ